jgi:spermidine synthase
VTLLIVVLFFCSGAAALIYEVLWARQLGLVFGATTEAASAVLAAYMLGLALGAALGGRWADRAKNPLRLYGLLEAGIGAAGLALPWAIARLPGLYAPLAGTEAGTGFALGLVRFALGLALLLLPTLLMGATFPALVRVLGGAGTRPLGRLYAANTLGAVAGTLAAGYILIARLGVSGTAALAATINLGVALVALLAAARGGSAGPPPAGVPAPDPRGAPGPPEPFPAAVALGLLALSGTTTLGTEILWTRTLVFSLWSTTYAFATMLGAFLGGLALGGALAARWLAAARRPWVTIAWLQGLLGLALLVPVAAVGPADAAFTAIQNWALGNRALSIAAHVAAVFVLLLPQTVLAGAAYPLLLRAAAAAAPRVGTGVGRGLFANTLGAAAGATAAAGWAIPALGILPAFAGLAAIWVAVGTLLGLRACGRPRAVSAAAGAGAAVLVAALAWGPLAAGRPNPFDDLTRLYAPGARVLAYREGAESTVAVVQLKTGPRVLRINGFEAAGVRGDRYTYMQLMAHLPLMLHPGPRDALVISFGTGTTAGAAARHALDRLDLVDLDPGVFAVADYFAPVNHGVLRDPRARAIVNDGRNFLALTHRRYDVITLEPMPPTFAGMVNLYSREFYETAWARLRPGGLMCQWVPFHLMSLGESLEVLRTFREVFPQSTLWLHGAQGFVIGAAAERFTVDAARLAGGLAARGVREDLARAGAAELVPLLNLLAWGPEPLRAATDDAAVVTDDHPTIEFPVVPFRIPIQWTLPAMRSAQALRLVYERRRAEPPPVANLPPAVAADLAEARAIFDQVALGGAALELDRPDAAEAIFRAGQAACQRDRCRAWFAYWLGATAERRGDLPAARRHWREAERLDPGRPEVREALARVGGDGSS